MDRARRIGWRMQGVLLTLALTAVLLRAALPTGWMVAPTAHGGFPMVICTAEGAAVATIDWASPDGRQKTPQDHEASADPPCAFAGHAAAAAPRSTAVVLVGVPIVDGPPGLRLAHLTPGRGLPAPPPPATGPPLLT